MSRTFYQLPAVQGPGLEFPGRLPMHKLTVPEGTVVIVMRAPLAGERGYFVAMTATVLDAVREMLRGWGPTEEGPGWVMSVGRTGETSYRVKDGKHEVITEDIDQMFEITILAAFEK